jgi:transketolase
MLTFKTEPTRKIFGETLAEYAAKDTKIVALTADVSSSVVTTVFAAKYPERFFNTGIAEQGMIDTAVGLALGGMTPFAATFAAMLLRTVEQIRTCVAYANTNVKIVGAYAGLSDYKDGPTHHSITDVAMMRSLPNIAVIVPADSTEVRKLVPLIAQHQGPVYLRMSRNDMPAIFDNSHIVEIGKGVTVQDGQDVTIIANGHMLSRSLQAAELLNEKGVSARVINIHTVKPLDSGLIKKCAQETGAIVTAEEHAIMGGLGSAVAELLSREFPVPVEMVGVADTFARTGPDHDSLLDYYGMSVDNIVKAAQASIKRKSGK